MNPIRQMLSLGLTQGRSLAVASAQGALLIVALMGSITSNGCSSRSDETVIPAADQVPQPSQEPGETPDPTKLKRVKVN